MTIRKIVLLLFSLASSIYAEGQEHMIHIFGKVEDSTHHPIDKAIVSIIIYHSQAGISFNTTREDGRFSFQIPDKYHIDSLAIKVNAVNFGKSIKHPVLLNRDNLIQLTSLQKTLPDVVVKGTKPIVQKGDTISYNADAFTKKSDRYLGDIIKNLPGITFDNSGIISYQGKPINNFYIGGDNLLDNRYQIATDNIPSTEIAKVQVIEHNQHVKMLNGIVPSDQAAINVTLKDKGKFHVINNAELEGGIPGKWNGAIHNMVFNDKYKAINELKSNNEGIDYSRETGLSGLGGAPNLPRNLSLFNKAVMPNLNNMYKFDKYRSLRLNGYYLHDKQSTENESSTTYYLPGNDTVKYNEANKNSMPTDAFNIQLNYNVNSLKTYFDNTLSISRTCANPGAEILSNGQNILQHNLTKNTSFSNTLQGYLQIHKKHLVNYYSSAQYSNVPQTLSISPGAMHDNLNDSVPYLNTRQLQRTATFYTNNNISYSHLLGHWILGTNTGLNYQQQYFHSNVQLLQNNHYTTGLADFSNDLHWQKEQIYLTPQIAFKNDRDQLNISAPVNFTHINYFNDSVLTNHDKLNHIFFNPLLSWQHKVGKESQISFTYNFGQQAATLAQIFGGKLLNGYRNYSSYNRPLLIGSAQTFDIGFNFKKMLLAFFANIDLAYSLNENYYIDSYTIERNLTTVTALPINNSGKNISVTCNASKYIYSFNTMVAINASFAHGTSQQMQNGVLFDVNNNTSAYKLNVTPTIADWLDVKLSTAYFFNTSSSTAAGFQRQSNSQFNETSSFIIYPVKNMSISFDNQYLQSSQRGQTISSAVLMNSYIQYNFQHPQWRKLQLRVSCNNMADVRYYYIVTTTNNMIATYSYLLQPRMLLLSAHFDL